MPAARYLGMSEFNLAFDQGVQQRPGASTSVEWYQNSGQYAASTTNYNYSSAPIGGGAAQYGSFEDEAPLLEGGLTKSVLKCTLIAVSSLTVLFLSEFASSAADERLVCALQSWE